MAKFYQEDPDSLGRLTFFLNNLSSPLAEPTGVQVRPAVVQCCPLMGSLPLNLKTCQMGAKHLSTKNVPIMSRLSLVAVGQILLASLE